MKIFKNLLLVMGIILIIGAAGGVDTDVCTIPQCIGIMIIGIGMIIPGVIRYDRKTIRK